MESLIFLISLIVIWIVVRKGMSSSATDQEAVQEIPVEISLETTFKETRFGMSDRTVDTGRIQESDNGSYILNPKSPLPISFEGCTLSQIRTIKTILDEESQWNPRAEELAFLIARDNLVCPELEAFLVPIRAKVTEIVERKSQNSDEWEASSPRDRADLMVEFRTEALSQLHVKPGNEGALKTLLFRAPTNVTADDDLLHRFSGNSELYKFYIRNMVRKTAVVRVAAAHYDRKRWESLEKLGLASRGKDISVETLLGVLRMKDINELFADRLQKRFTRKAHAVEFAAQQVDVYSILSQQISFREMFQICIPSAVNISDVKACYEYASAQAEIIRDTYVSGYRTLESLLDGRHGHLNSWKIRAEGCCRACARFEGKKTKRPPTKVPPFHVGCRCSLEVWYD